MQPHWRRYSRRLFGTGRDGRGARHLALVVSTSILLLLTACGRVSALERETWSIYDTVSIKGAPARPWSKTQPSHFASDADAREAEQLIDQDGNEIEADLSGPDVLGFRMADLVKVTPDIL